MLIDGRWSSDWTPKDADDRGAFERKASTFRNWITPNGEAGPTGDGGFAAEPGRYHLYVGLICPWACRTLMVRKLKKLDSLIDVSIVNPSLSDQGWQFGGFPGATADALGNASFMHEIYTRADPRFTGRATVPVLWDKQRGTIVNNESADIVRMLNTAFAALAPASLDLYPDDLRAEIDALNAAIYPRLNNGVYRAGFATSQAAYETAFADVFGMLDDLESRLGTSGFLFGEQLTEADIRLFVTLIRFDAAYHGAFKCNLRRIADYPKLQAYTARMLGIEGLSETVSIAHIKAGYYSIKAINPTGIVPVGPILDLPNL
ncbi:glutathione S-transferase family protein [Lichenihabitans psoromatis]|uniref:glutathione S-transferase family protein n=1 Tax=Lichenihabitans psoromatis TaxID=2528642 RepID=UPI00103830BA|nr:glutathione S-transferase family protein [Lichenihabitans psoromatis]